MDGMAGPEWIDQLNAVRMWISQHGRAPSTRDADPRAAELGRWWLRQGMLRERLSANRRAALEDTARLVREVRAARVKPNPMAVKLQKRAALVDIRHARAAVDSPDLLPGDREVLQARIDHPEETRRQLALRLGTTATAYAQRLRAALRRGTPGTRR